MDDH